MRNVSATAALIFLVAAIAGRAQSIPSAVISDPPPDTAFPAWNVGGEVAALKSASDRAQEVKSFAESIESLTGCTPEALTAEAIAHQTEWNFIAYADALASHPLLLITSDDGNAPDSRALATAARKAGDKGITEVHFPTDHPYSDHRIALQAALVRWLEALDAAKL